MRKNRDHEEDPDGGWLLTAKRSLESPERSDQEPRGTDKYLFLTSCFGLGPKFKMYSISKHHQQFYYLYQERI